MPIMSTSEVSFQGLQAALTQAKASLDKVYQISTALEAKASKAEPIAEPPGSVRPPLEPTQNISPQPPTQESFEQSIAEMRRIAGLR